MTFFKGFIKLWTHEDVLSLFEAGRRVQIIHIFKDGLKVLSQLVKGEKVACKVTYLV